MKKVWNAKTNEEQFFSEELSDLQCLLYCYAEENHLLSDFFYHVHSGEDLQSYVDTHCLVVVESKSGRCLALDDFIIQKG